MKNCFLTSILLVLFCLAGCVSTPPSVSDLSAITDDVLMNNFLSACEEIEIDTDKIDSFTKVDDWTSGSRYSFIYSGLNCVVYCNADSTIASINVGTSDRQPYKQGLSSYSIKEHIVDSGVVAQLEVFAENAVKDTLNYPSTASFSLFDWSCSRDGGVYILSSSVTAKNAFGVESEMPFTVYFDTTSEKAVAIYLSVNGTVAFDKRDTIKERVRTEVPVDSPVTDGILLKAGELGEYGKSVLFNGEAFILYYVPAGTYSITNNGKVCKVYLDKNETYVEEGYTNCISVLTLDFSEYGETQTITVGEDEHIELTTAASVTLKPIE